MENPDAPLAHHYDLPVASRLSHGHPESELLLRPGSASDDHAIGGGLVTAVRGMAMPSGRSNMPLRAQEPLVDSSSFDMDATPRSCPLEHQTLPMQQQQSHVQHLYPQRCQPQSDLSSSGADATTAPKPIRRRMRMITSCLECRRRKLKCNKSQPCSNCLKFSRDCLYLGPKLDEASQLRLTEIKEKVGSLERQLERDVAKSGAEFGGTGGRGLSQQRMLADYVEEGLDEADDLEITPMVALDLMYENNPNVTDDILDLGVQVGRMRLTERIGGINRPRISEETNQIQAGLSGRLPHLEGLSTGLASPVVDPPPPPPPSQSGPFSDSITSDKSLPNYLRPGASYLPPTSGLIFGQVGQSPALLSFLPTKPAGDRLLDQYFDSVHPIARCVHRPCFQTHYVGFWEEVTAGYEPRSSAQAMVFAAWFSAAVAMDENAINREFGYTKANLVENMKIATEVALSKANFLRTTKFETLQALVMYMIPLCREEVSRAHSVLVGAAIRMAECMGLHRDGRQYKLNPLETHIRRLVWHQLCFLDIRTCEAQGPRPTIRREAYDTWLPDNCEEDQLPFDASPVANPHLPSEGWTSTLLPLIRFEINEMMRILWVDRYKLESRKITLTQALTKIETFRKRMLASYDHLIDERVPIQRYAKLVMHLLLHRLHVMILHPYYANTTSAMPPRLQSVLVMSGIMIIELAIQLDTDPAFRLWRWYAGAYQQYQAALILVTEIYYYPAHKESERIWTCLDHVFELDGNVNTKETCIQILTDIMGKMGAYVSMRKVRLPVSTASASPQNQAVKAEWASSGPRERAGSTPSSSVLSQNYSQMRSRRLPMRLETGLASLVGLGPRSGSSLYSPSRSETPTSSATESSPRFPHLQQRSTPTTPYTATANNPREGGLWALRPPQLHSDSSENSSSDSGGQRQNSMGGMRAAVLGGAPPHLIEGQWSNYQEDATNALFPFDPQTGSFAGFGDPLTNNVANHNSDWT